MTAPGRERDERAPALSARPDDLDQTERPAVPATRRALRRRRWRLPVLPLVIALACLVGAGLLLYPQTASWFAQRAQSEQVDGYGDAVQDLGAATLHERVEEAREYNRALVGSRADIAANERLPLAEASGDPDVYGRTLAADADGLMARLRIPAIDVDLPVYHGTGEDVLHRGVGHLRGTALPVGGDTTHSVLTAHRGLATAELFSDLDRVGTDDTFTLEVFGETLAYRVIETRVVAPEDTETLLAQPGRDLVTLVTCTPLGINSHRILVTGERIIPTPQEEIDRAGEDAHVLGFPWWAAIAVGALAAAGVYVYASGRPPRARPDVSKR